MLKVRFNLSNTDFQARKAAAIASGRSRHPLLLSALLLFTSPCVTLRFIKCHSD